MVVTTTIFASVQVNIHLHSRDSFHYNRGDVVPHHINDCTRQPSKSILTTAPLTNELDLNFDLQQVQAFKSQEPIFTSYHFLLSCSRKRLNDYIMMSLTRSWLS